MVARNHRLIFPLLWHTCWKQYKTAGICLSFTFFFKIQFLGNGDELRRSNIFFSNQDINCNAKVLQALLEGWHVTCGAEYLETGFTCSFFVCKCSLYALPCFPQGLTAILPWKFIPWKSHRNCFCKLRSCWPQEELNAHVHIVATFLWSLPKKMNAVMIWLCQPGISGADHRY